MIETYEATKKFVLTLSIISFEQFSKRLLVPFNNKLICSLKLLAKAVLIYLISVLWTPLNFQPLPQNKSLSSSKNLIYYKTQIMLINHQQQFLRPRAIYDTDSYEPKFGRRIQVTSAAITNRDLMLSTNYHD